MKSLKYNKRYGHKNLIVWQNASELRLDIYKMTKEFGYGEKRRIEQMRDAARSVRDNITEGYYRNSLGEYIRFLEISRGSLEELGDQIGDCFDDDLIKENKYQELNGLHKRTSYLLDRLLNSLRQKRNKGDWKKL